MLFVQVWYRYERTNLIQSWCYYGTGSIPKIRRLALLSYSLLINPKLPFAHCAENIVSVRYARWFCVGRKGGTGEVGGVTHSDMHMVVAGLSCQSAMVGTRYLLVSRAEVKWLSAWFGTSSRSVMSLTCLPTVMWLSPRPSLIGPIQFWARTRLSEIHGLPNEIHSISDEIHSLPD